MEKTVASATAARFAGKTAIVTGCSGGQGRSHMLALAGEGALVLGIDVDKDGGTELEELLRAAGKTVEFFNGDVGEAADWERAIQRVLELSGRIDILVNNAAIYSTEDYLSETLEGWERIIKNDQTSVFLGIKHVLPVMIEQGGGWIINICSNCGVAAIPNFGGVSCSQRSRPYDDEECGAHLREAQYSRQ